MAALRSHRLERGGLYGSEEEAELHTIRQQKVEGTNPRRASLRKAVEKVQQVQPASRQHQGQPWQWRRQAALTGGTAIIRAESSI